MYLRSFPAVASAERVLLEDVVIEMVAEVLPSLALIYLEGQPTLSFETFSAIRQLSGRISGHRVGV